MVAQVRCLLRMLYRSLIYLGCLVIISSIFYAQQIILRYLSKILFMFMSRLSKASRPSTPASPTLSVSLVANPSSLYQINGAATSTNLTATVSGTVKGTINYTLYCNRSDTGTNITSPNSGQFSNVSATSESFSCSYSSLGTYTPKVIVGRGSLAAQDQVTVNVVKSSACWIF